MEPTTIPWRSRTISIILLSSFETTCWIVLEQGPSLMYATVSGELEGDV